MNQSMTAVTMTKTSSHRLKFAKSEPRARTVPKSVMKHAARMVFPKGVSPRPPSIMTAYTTATEVVESAIPAIWA